METSDSDVESECFESAEESLDENEELNESKTKTLPKSEGEISGPTGDNTDSVNDLGKNNSNNLLSYRKRPERLKSISNKPPVKLTPRLSTGEVKSKADKIVPDVFLQDITCNLSKNFNKSLNTIQQTSSNVKGLILSSLPVSSSVNDQGFTYDDRDSIFDDETATADSEIKAPEESLGIGEKNDINSKEDSFKIEEVVNEKSLPNTEKSESQDTSKPLLKDVSHNLETTVKNVVSVNEVKDSEQEGNIKESNEESIEHVTENTHALETSPPKVEEESLISSVETYDTDTLPEKQDILNKSDAETVSCIDNVKEFNNEESKNTESSLFIDNEKVTETKEAEVNTGGVFNELKNALKSIVKEETSCAESLDKDSKEETKSSLSLDKDIKGETSYVESLDENSKEETSCVESLDKDSKEETKSSLSLDKDIKGETSCVEGLDKDSKEETCLEEKIDFNENENEGWDDFDFSDNEIEVVSKKSENKPFEKESADKNPAKTDRVSETSQPTSQVSNSRTLGSNQSSFKENIPTSEKSVKKRHENKNLVAQKQNIIKNTVKSKESVENNPDQDDNWGWDNWDETETDKDQVEASSNNSENKNVKNDNVDVSKWSGWETFGQKQQEKEGTWGFASWGVDALLNKATAVTQGISSVLEAGLGAPDPETLARMDIENRKSQKDIDTDSENQHIEISKKNSLSNVNIFPVSGITNLVAGVTSKIVEHSKIQEIGTKVITGGLDTLETFGKKTMEVLQEGDPGLRNKRALLLGNNKPVLSQVLREAREKANTEMKIAEEKELARKCHFETLFDDYQGMVHLEALEMVSRQCEIKLDQIRSEKNSEEQQHLNELLEEIQQLCCLDDCDMELKSVKTDFKTALQMAVKPLKNEISIDKLIKIHEDVSNWLQNASETKTSSTVIYQKLVSTLAELTSATVHQFHKGGELLSVGQCRMTLEEVDGLSSLTNVMCNEINHLCEKFYALSCSGKSVESGGDNTKSLKDKITEVQKNSTFYIKQAFDLLIPVIQLGGVASS